MKITLPPGIMNTEMNFFCIIHSTCNRLTWELLAQSTIMQILTGQGSKVLVNLSGVYAIHPFPE